MTLQYDDAKFLKKVDFHRDLLNKFFHQLHLHLNRLCEVSIKIWSNVVKLFDDRRDWQVGPMLPSYTGWKNRQTDRNQAGCCNDFFSVLVKLKQIKMLRWNKPKLGSEWPWC